MAEAVNAANRSLHAIQHLIMHRSHARAPILERLSAEATSSSGFALADDSPAHAAVRPSVLGTLGVCASCGLPSASTGGNSPTCSACGAVCCTVCAAETSTCQQCAIVCAGAKGIVETTVAAVTGPVRMD